MRPIKLNDKEKSELINKLLKQFMSSLDNYTFGNSTKISFEANIGGKLKEKIKLVYSPSAWLRMNALVDNFSSEVSWFGLVDKTENPLVYYIYDVLVCKQQVNGAKVDTEDEDMLEFLSGLTDEEAEHLHFQAHSHVNMSTSASGTDLQNQADILANMPGNDGFYIFQIWNKRGDIDTYFYDLTNNVFYDKNDVEVLVEDTKYGTTDDFVAKAKKMVSSITPKKTKNVKENNSTADKIRYYYGGGYGYEDGYYYPGYGYTSYLDNYSDPLEEDEKEMMEMENELS